MKLGLATQGCGWLVEDVVVLGLLVPLGRWWLKFKLSLKVEVHYNRDGRKNLKLGFEILASCNSL